MDKALLTPKEIAGHLSINYHKVLEMLNAGIIKSYRIGKQFRISQGQLNEFLSKSKHKPHRIHSLN
ncbi:MAG: helix-turn-helix domain-containing protein [Candidatus Marinimicrobia bacterium]|jgi:excisionase family DNA binding protein|nr:helix-turn-helix domain-containing protein [Candidatus Neomarinimicrobiota bacterium]